MKTEPGMWQQAVNIYTKLYKKTDCKDDLLPVTKFLDNTPTPSLLKKEVLDAEAPIKCKVVGDFINVQASNKAAGTTGVTA